MRVLIVKITSLGDIIHLLPALTDAQAAIPGIRFDWVVEEPFQEVPRWHPAVDRVITVQLREWRKQPFSRVTRDAWRRYKKTVSEYQYDKVIDAQSLMKSALLARKARGPRYGLDFRSAWEPLASLMYHHRVKVNPKDHAVVRMRQLMAACLEYPCPVTPTHYGLSPGQLEKGAMMPHYQDSVVFIHGTTWVTKEWPVTYWQQLLQRVVAEGYQVLIPWGNEKEYQRAQVIASAHPQAHVLPRLSLSEIAAVLAHARGAIAVDTGIGHLAAALALPTLSLYGPTDPLATGTLGLNQGHLAAKFACAPCFNERCHYKDVSEVEPACFAGVNPDKAWQGLKNLMETAIVA